ncbi:cytochrome P450 [Rhodococcus pseudokoreensis]|uniref:Cytochrome P450 n=1 Tax=Rhodococcus pseudokoreensis TaxID=2811421 RepID=A0A974VZT4_9NOCA|nr:cytochrome P450 [Rhodococcus pseudokoreensis]QSE88157.1 cytochrome P450 [Rhodococcus pseudokoreensis]
MPAPTDAVLTDFDHHSPDFAERPFRVLEELRNEAPIAWSTAHGGFWVVTDHEHVVDGLADYATFSSSSGPAIPDNPFGTRHIPVAMDPPVHSVYRKVLNDWYSKANITARTPQIEEMVRGIVSGLAERGSWDFVADLANVSPGAVTLGILGWNTERRLELLDVMTQALRNQASTDPDAIEQNAAGNRWIREQILTEADDRRATPRDDLMTVLATQPIADGRPLTDEELCDCVVLLLLAGFHTTSGAFTALMTHLERHPDDKVRLQQDRDLIPNAIEEIIRIYSPATAHARKVTADTEFGGVRMREGDWTLFVNMAANHDPAAFSDPEAVDLDRNRAKSVAFGWGVHRCLGLHLARLILRVEVEAVFDLLPGYRIDLENSVLSHHMGQGYFYLSVPADLPKGA